MFFLCIAACMYSFSLPTFKYSNSFPSFLLLIRVRKPYCYSLKEQERAPTIAILIVGIVKTIEREIRKKQRRLRVITLQGAIEKSSILLLKLEM